MTKVFAVPTYRAEWLLPSLRSLFYPSDQIDFPVGFESVSRELLWRPFVCRGQTQVDVL
jgi:hypothetical protein